MFCLPKTAWPPTSVVDASPKGPALRKERKARRKATNLAQVSVFGDETPAIALVTR